MSKTLGLVTNSFVSFILKYRNKTELVLTRPVRGLQKQDRTGIDQTRPTDGLSPTDSMSLDSDSTVLMCLSLSRWGFPCPDRHLQIYH